LGDGLGDIAWFDPGGREMIADDWDRGVERSLCVFINGEAIPGLDEKGRRVLDDSFLLLFNASWEPCEFVIPAQELSTAWELVLDTADPECAERSATYQNGDALTICAHSLRVLRRPRGEDH
jgi:glycogen operon protein